LLKDACFGKLKDPVSDADIDVCDSLEIAVVDAKAF
jgi:hypothetical protein